MDTIVRLDNDLYHFDCLAADIGEQLTRTLETVSESELAQLALSGEYPTCSDCNASLVPIDLAYNEPGAIDD